MSQSANQQTRPIYEPLHVPEENPESKTRWSRFKEFFVNHTGMSLKAQCLVAQMEQRPPLSDEIWGPDAKRRALANEVAEIIRDEIGWPNARFIPADPFNLVTCNIHWDACSMDGCEVECVMLRIAQATCIDYYDEEVWNTFWYSTFGEVVDALLQDPADPVTAIRRVPRWPSEGPNALETLPCTTPAVFFDIRRYLTQEKFGVDKSTVHPTSPLPSILKKVPSYELEYYLIRRFNVECELLYTFPELDMAKAGLVGTLIVVTSFLTLISAAIIMSPEAGDWQMLFLPIGFAVIGLGVTLFFSLPALLSRDFWRKVFWKPPKTVKDLIERIQRERASQS